MPNLHTISGVAFMAEIDLTSEQKVDVAIRTRKPPIRWLWFDDKFFALMLSTFKKNWPNESICWGSGPAILFGNAVLGYIVRFWRCELEYSSSVGTKTSVKWLVEFPKRLVEEEPGHKVILEAHSHPIGSELSSVDESGLFALNDWGERMYWVMVACDFQLGVHIVDEETQRVVRIPWGIDGTWVEEERKENNSSGTEISSTTSGSSLATRILGRLRREQ